MANGSGTIPKVNFCNLVYSGSLCVLSTGEPRDEYRALGLQGSAGTDPVHLPPGSNISYGRTQAVGVVGSSSHIRLIHLILNIMGVTIVCLVGTGIFNSFVYQKVHFVENTYIYSHKIRFRYWYLKKKKKHCSITGILHFHGHTHHPLCRSWKSMTSPAMSSPPT